ncbi:MULTISPECIES: AfsR/SARP family transcriptional regulator [unclassified Streptomyces]|uniref:AfsR/SARP family transcriptional regulator n=1 Tax=unclassified Streptomyces TaxID=2593676 RepID=UPI0013E0C847|nr:MULTISPECIES: BTAD domain-containing putative transcriptional regulator [unclassified Streptomyces]
MRFGVLGRLTVWRAGVPLGLGTPKGRLILAVLLARPGLPVTADALAEALWGEERPRSAVKNVQTYVHRLRQLLGEPDRIVRQGEGYLVRAGRDELDATRFDDLAETARAALAAGDPATARRVFGEALDLWRGPAFEGVADVPALTVQAARLDEARLGVLEERVDADLRLGRHDELLGELTALTMEHPFRERMWAQLMLALDRCGRRTEALRAYHRLRAVLAQETGLEPGAEVREVHRAILEGDRAPAPAGADTGAGRPEVPVARMLPPALHDFSGQRAELTRIETVLRAERAAGAPPGLVTVSGPGGIGKTALAVQAAHRLGSAYPDGQLFAALAGARAQPAEPAAVLGRFLRALGVPATAVPDDPEERTALYRGLLAERRVLVVLDDAYDEDQVAPLMPAGGSCGVIITGRVRLGGLGGASRIELREMSREDGLAMLRAGTGDRLASATGTEPDDLVRLCARLPLALRIVASLLVSRPHWRPADLVARLADEQHRLDALRYRDLEVRASFGLSYAGLGPGARRLFRLLGLLEAPDFPLWAAAAAADTSLAEAQDLLDDLVDVHLLDITGTHAGQVRYGFHDLIRAYARERAEAEEAPEVREAAVVRVLCALLALTDIADRDHMGQSMFQRDAPRWRPERVEASLPPSVPPMALLGAERGALVAGVRQAAELGRDELCWELAVGAHALFETERYYDDWQECYDTAMALAAATGNLRGRARLLISMAGLRYMRRRYGPAEEANTEAMRLFERIGDRRGHQEALSNAPFFLVPAGRLSAAVTMGTEAYRLLLADGQAAAALHAYSQVGLAHLQAGRAEAAVEVLTEIVARAREHGIRTLVARDVYWLGQAWLALGRHERAEEAFTELTSLVEDIGSSGPFYLAHAWGCLHLTRGEYAEARRRLLEALDLARTMDDPMFQTRVLADLLDLRLYDVRDGRALRAALDRAEHAVGVARGIHYPYLLAGVLEKTARLREAAGETAAARELDEEAAAVRARVT